MIGCDVVLLVAILWFCQAAQRGELVVPRWPQTALLLAAPAVSIPIFIRLGLYRSVIRYLSDRAAWTIFQGTTFAALIWVMLASVAAAAGIAELSFVVPVLYWALSFFAIGGVRYLARWTLWSPLRNRFGGRQVLIYGTGDAGRQIAAALRMAHDSLPIGFLDDDPDLRGRDVAGLRVYPPSHLPVLIRDFGVREVIVCLRSLGAVRQRQVLEWLSGYDVQIRLLPTITDIARGRYLVSQVRDIDIADLLGRSTIESNMDLLTRPVAGQTVLVTGAGGSIGSELCRQITSLRPARIVLLEADEHALYQIDRELRQLTEAPIASRLGSIAHEATVARIFRDYDVSTVFHAAAHKHVPLVEANPTEGIRNNVIGTNVLATAAFAAGVERFVLISSDKAVQPTSVMGATKHWCEVIVQNFARLAREQKSGQRFCSVRFGNVLGSRGSVVPLFKEQIARGGPVTLTHEEMTRYFMSIHEAVELIIQTGSLSVGGEVFLLDMGEPIRIRDLAVKMIRLAGLTVQDDHNPEGDIEIKLIGPRPGEKLREELFYDPAHANPTRHPKIFRIETPKGEPNEFYSAIKELEAAVTSNDEAEARRVLFGFVAAPKKTVRPEIRRESRPSQGEGMPMAGQMRAPGN